jgi:hypothetical protein
MELKKWQIGVGSVALLGLGMAFTPNGLPRVEASRANPDSAAYIADAKPSTNGEEFLSCPTEGEVSELREQLSRYESKEGRSNSQQKSAEKAKLKAKIPVAQIRQVKEEIKAEIAEGLAQKERLSDIEKYLSSIDPQKSFSRKLNLEELETIKKELQTIINSGIDEQLERNLQNMIDYIEQSSGQTPPSEGFNNQKRYPYRETYFSTRERIRSEVMEANRQRSERENSIGGRLKRLLNTD